jgi:hypothetical protein
MPKALVIASVVGTTQFTPTPPVFEQFPLVKVGKADKGERSERRRDYGKPPWVHRHCTWKRHNGRWVRECRRRGGW